MQSQIGRFPHKAAKRERWAKAFAPSAFIRRSTPTETAKSLVNSWWARFFRIPSIKIRIRPLATVFGVDTQLIADGTYFVTEAGSDVDATVPVVQGAPPPSSIVGCGGWSKRKTLYGGDQWTSREAALLDPQHDAAKIRAFFVHPAWARRGIGSMILAACESAARTAGFTRFEMGATLTGVPLYQARGYVALENLEVPLENGEALPIVHMEKRVP